MHRQLSNPQNTRFSHSSRATAGKSYSKSGLDQLMARNVEARQVSFTTDLKAAVEADEAVFIVVGMPTQRGDGQKISLSRGVSRKRFAEMLAGGLRCIMVKNFCLRKQKYFYARRYGLAFLSFVKILFAICRRLKMKYRNMSFFPQNLGQGAFVA